MFIKKSTTNVTISASLVILLFSGSLDVAEDVGPHKPAHPVIHYSQSEQNIVSENKVAVLDITDLGGTNLKFIA